MSNARVYTLFFIYLTNARLSQLFREIHHHGEAAHDEMAGQVRPDGVQP